VNGDARANCEESAERGPGGGAGAGFGGGAGASGAAAGRGAAARGGAGAGAAGGVTGRGGGAVGGDSGGDGGGARRDGGGGERGVDDGAGGSGVASVASLSHQAAGGAGDPAPEGGAAPAGADGGPAGVQGAGGPGERGGAGRAGGAGAGRGDGLRAAMKPRRALLDANVLYPAPLRDVFLQLAVLDLFQARWSAEIHREWIEALLRSEPWRERRTLERTRALMDQATRDCVVTGFEGWIPQLKLPDPDDRHVLAAAIQGRCDVIVTRNLRDFPAPALAEFGLVAQEPDEFLYRELRRAPDAFCLGVRKVRARLKNPPYPVGEYLETLEAQGLEATVRALRGSVDEL